MSLTFSSSISCGHVDFNGESTVLKYFQGDRHIPHPLAFRHIISGMTEPYRNLIFYANRQWRYGDSPIYIAASVHTIAKSTGQIRCANCECDPIDQLSSDCVQYCSCPGLMHYIHVSS